MKTSTLHGSARPEVCRVTRAVARVSRPYVTFILNHWAYSFCNSSSPSSGLSVISNRVTSCVT